ncbi:MAG TPA: cytochrome P450 [Terriglobales bacterium]|nr:cytochrome P450 [Terriglobales bacterium]
MSVQQPTSFERGIPTHKPGEPQNSPTVLQVPGPKRDRVLPRTLLTYRRDPLGFLTRLARTYGDIARFYFGPQQVWLLNHPDYVKDVLVTNNRKLKKGRILERAKQVLGEGLLTSEDPLHLRQRRLMQPAFKHDNIAAYARLMVDYADNWQQSWRHGETRDIHAEMMGLTLAVVAKALFGTDIQDKSGEIGDALNAIIDVFDFVMLPFSDILQHLPLPQVRRIHKARQKLDRIVYRIIEEARARAAGQTGSRIDLLSMLLAVQNEAAEDGDGSAGGMSDEQLRDECVTLILAGHETTAVTLSWTWYLLSQNRAAEAKLHAELDSCLGSRLATVEDLPRLTYTRRVLAESMRLYPPAWGVGRKTLEPYSIGGYTIPKGAIVLVSEWVMHRDARFFPDPEVFDPDRWSPGARETRSNFAYFPFGGGPRQCIGEDFAWMEGTLLLATIAQKWRLRLVPGHPVEPKPVITLRPKYGIKMSLERR